MPLLNIQGYCFKFKFIYEYTDMGIIKKYTNFKVKWNIISHNDYSFTQQKD